MVVDSRHVELYLLELDRLEWIRGKMTKLDKRQTGFFGIGRLVCLAWIESDSEEETERPRKEPTDLGPWEVNLRRQTKCPLV